MKLFSLALATLFTPIFADKVPWERLEIDKAVLLILDLQVGLYGLARDFDPTLYQRNLLAHAAIGQIFDIPVILTTSAQNGPNGPLPKEILEMYPDAPLIQRNGQVSAWDNEHFRNAVRATNRTQIIVGGIVTDAPLSWLWLFGKKVIASRPMSRLAVRTDILFQGTTTGLIREISNDRMRQAGVNIVSLFYIVCDLMKNWTFEPGITTILPWLDTYYPAYGYIARSHAAAIQNGSIAPGELELISSANGSLELDKV
ncbi:Isochorismatase hydrolase [Aureobasidium pullulans]|uniref:Isochorismatase hydrolase n=1 Tax=Aureobasidium pullulans TaxID=5580 RepID=A0AB74JSK9_AURPU|nr:Isochorismatase hydrolase [Aureobasidium pullulans]